MMPFGKYFPILPCADDDDTDGDLNTLRSPLSVPSSWPITIMSAQCSPDLSIGSQIIVAFFIILSVLNCVRTATLTRCTYMVVIHVGGTYVSM